MKKLVAIALLGAAVMLYGCIEYEEDLVLNADRSGTVKVKYAMSEQLAAMMAMGAGDQDKGELPVDKEKVEKLFSGKEGLKVSNISVELKEKKKVVSFTVAFDDVDNLAKSNFALFKEGLTFTRNEDGTFTYERKMSDTGGPKAQPEKKEGAEGEVPEGMEEMGEEMGKAMMKGMMEQFGLPKFTYKLTLPGTITETNADSHEGRAAQWKVEADVDNPDAMEGKVMTAKSLAAQEKKIPILPIAIAVVIVLVGVVVLLIVRRK